MGNPRENVMKMQKRVLVLGFLSGALVLSSLAGCNKPADPATQAAKADATAATPAPDLAETKAIAEQAYIYGFPMIAAYKAMYEFNIDKSSSQ